MTPEEVKALIEASLSSALPAALKGLFGEFQNHFETQLKPISDRLSQFEVAGSPEVEPETSKDPLAF